MLHKTTTASSHLPSPPLCKIQPAKKKKKNRSQDIFFSLASSSMISMALSISFSFPTVEHAVPCDEHADSTSPLPVCAKDSCSALSTCIGFLRGAAELPQVSSHGPRNPRNTRQKIGFSGGRHAHAIDAVISIWDHMLMTTFVPVLCTISTERQSRRVRITYRLGLSGYRRPRGHGV